VVDVPGRGAALRLAPILHTLTGGRRIGNDRHLSGTTSQLLYDSDRRLIGGILPTGTDHGVRGRCSLSRPLPAALDTRVTSAVVSHS